MNQILFGITYRLLRDVIWQVSFAEDIVGIMVAYVTVQMAMVFSS